jgi:hypothetical protein
MRYSITGLAAASAFCAGMTVFAQVGTQSTTPLPDGAVRGQPGDMVISGCLKSSSTDTKKGVTIYTLEGRAVRPDGEAPGAQARQEVATAPHTAPITPANTVYTMSSTTTVPLAEHVGQKVELTGRLQPPAAEPRATGTAGTTGAQAQGETGAGGAHRTFEASQLKMLSMKCE